MLLAGCAPSLTAGATPDVLVSPISTIVVKPGTTRYVEVLYPRSVIRVNEKFFTDLKIDFNDRNSLGNVRSPETRATWLTMSAKDLPEGVSVALDRAFILKEVKETTNTSRETTVNYFEKIRVVYKITAQTGAPADDLALTRVEFSDGTTTSPVLLNLSIKP